MMQFSIVGTGNMAWFLAALLQHKGYRLQGVYGRDATKAQELAQHFGCSSYATLQSIPDLENHLCFLAVKDDAISSLAAALHFEQSILVHTAGANPMSLLGHTCKHQAVIWPIYSINRDTAIKSPNTIPFAIEANHALLAQSLLEWGQSLSSNAFLANREQRSQLHLAAVFANNFSNHMMAIAQKICQEQAVDFDYLKPIMMQTFERIALQSPYETQTGPAIRGDVSTQEKQLKMLATHPDWQGVYQIISDSIRKMYTSID